MNILILGGAARLGPYVARALESEHMLPRYGHSAGGDAA